MKKTEKLVLNVLQNKQVNRMPIWLMRQAGRYLPEYRELRKKAEGFIPFCLTPDLATEATLQPIRRFDMDAAILFADILLVPYAFGQKIEFQEKIGPLLEPVTEEKQLGRLKWNCDKLEATFETIERVKDELPDETTFLGFAGGLWTVACYMIEGRGRVGFRNALRVAESDPQLLNYLLDSLHDATLEYLGRQIEAGVDAIQLFESHAGILRGEAFEKYVIAPTKRLVSALKAEYPKVPVIGFPRGARQKDYEKYAIETGVDCLGLDQHLSLPFAQRVLRCIKPLQGNMDPELLLKGGERMREAVRDIYHRFGPNHIFNLGHGVIKETPPENVADLVAFVKGLEKGA